MNNPFSKPVDRGGILTLKDGSRVRIKAKIYPKPRYTQGDYERELMEWFNNSQPNMPNKAVRCHLTRN